MNSHHAQLRRTSTLFAAAAKKKTPTCNRYLEYSSIIVAQ